MNLSCFPVEFWIFSAFFDNDEIKISNVMVLRIEMNWYSFFPLVSYISQMLFYSFRYCPLGLPDIYYFLALLTVYSVNCVCCLTVCIFWYLFNFRNFYIISGNRTNRAVVCRTSVCTPVFIFEYFVMFPMKTRFYATPFKLEKQSFWFFSTKEWGCPYWAKYWE